MSVEEVEHNFQSGNFNTLNRAVKLPNIKENTIPTFLFNKIPPYQFGYFLLKIGDLLFNKLASIV